MKKRLLTPLLALCIAASATATGFAMTNVSAKADDTPKANWTDGLTYDADYGYGGGRGVGGDPYLISTPEHLAQLAVNLNYDVDLTANYSQGKYFKITNDIDVSGKNWTPIGNKIGAGRNNTFYGAMDFNGYSVTGIEHDGYDGQFFGFFGAFSIGWVKNPRISYGDVTVNYTGGTGSVVDNSGVTSYASFGGVAGVMIGGIIGYDDGSDIVVDVDYYGDISFTTSKASVRSYHGGVIGNFIGGIVGNKAEEGDVTVTVDIQDDASLSFINKNTYYQYAGGMFGHGNTNGVYVGQYNEHANGDVTIAFTNHNDNEDEKGFYAESSGSGRVGLIAGEANFMMGNNGDGTGDVTISATNYGTVHYLSTTKVMNYAGGMFGAIGGLKGTRGTGDVTIKLDNYGMIKAENNAAEETRFGGIAGYTGDAVVGIDNAASNGNVFISVINHGDAKMYRADNWNYYTAMQFGYVASSTIGTKGTGNAGFVLQTLINNFYNNNGKLVWLFVNTHDAASKFGSLNGGDTTDMSKSICWMLTETKVGTGTHGFRFDWQKSLGFDGKITESDHAAWEITGATTEGVVYSAKVDAGYGFVGYGDETPVTVDANGVPYVVFTGDVLPAIETIALADVVVDFTAVDYTGSVLQPTLAGYTVVALDANGAALNATMPGTHNVYAVELYKDGIFVGTKEYEAPQAFVINKLANNDTANTAQVTFDPNTETYSAPSDFEVASDELFTNIIPNSGSLTDYKGGSIYVRIRETATHLASAPVAIAINAYTVTFTNADGVTITAEEDKATYMQGAYYIFTLEVKEGYEVSTLVVTVNGAAIEADNGEYYVLIQDNTVIDVQGVSLIVHYNVNIVDNGVATVTPVENGPVKEGANFMFTVESDKDIIVMVNGTVVEAESGIYTIENVTEDIEIQVVEKEVPPEESSSDTTSSTEPSTESSSAGNGGMVSLAGCFSAMSGLYAFGALAVALACVAKKRRD